MVRHRAFSIIEIIIVAAIVGTLVAILGVLVGSSIRKRGVVASIGEELRQANDGIHLYMVDYDDHYPPTLETVQQIYPSVPVGPSKGTAKKFPECGYNSDEFYYARNYAILRGETKYKVNFPFDLNKNAILKAPAVCRITGAKHQQMFLENGVHPIYRLRDERYILGVRFDGSLGWFDSWETWEDEYAHLAHQ